MSGPREQPLTIPEAADLIGVSPRTARRLITAGELRAYRVGRLVRVREADANAFVAARFLVAPAGPSEPSGTVVREGERLWD